MMQTPNYKLNKPEMSDTFSTAPLSENMDKVEGALDALDARTVNLENRRIVLGRYWGNDGEQIIDLGGRPVAVLVSSFASHLSCVAMVVGEMESLDKSHNVALKIVDNGFFVRERLNVSHTAEKTYCYAAFFGDWPVKNFMDDPA